MGDKTDKVNALYEAHGERFSGGFHNMLWQLLVNESLAASDAQYAFHVLHTGTMVISASDGGYLSGCQCRVIDGATFEPGHNAARRMIWPAHSTRRCSGCYLMPHCGLWVLVFASNAGAGNHGLLCQINTLFQ